MRPYFAPVFLGLLLAACQSVPVQSDSGSDAAPISSPVSSTNTSADTQASTVTTASWYQCCTTTANGERFNPDGLTAAHKTLAFGTRVRVTNLANNRAVTVRINDRGPFIAGRGIDLSRGAARAIGCISSGTCRVSMQVL